MENKYGNWLRAARKDADLTQQELADKVGIRENYVRMLERGHQKTKKGNLTRVDLDICDRISAAVGKSALEGRNAAGYLPEDSQDFVPIALDLETLSPENRRAAVTQMKKVYDRYREKESKRSGKKVQARI